MRDSFSFVSEIHHIVASATFPENGLKMRLPSDGPLSATAQHFRLSEKTWFWKAHASLLDLPLGVQARG
jgi:hypothetical protein